MLPDAMQRLAFDRAGDWARASIGIARQMTSAGFSAAEKGALFDMITPVDAAIENFVRQQVQESFPDHAFLGEEGGGTDGEWQWVVDPIDGTLNFATGLAGAACSIALARNGEPVAGAIGDFASGRTYRALAGTGSILCHDGVNEAPQAIAHSQIGRARVFLEWGWEDLDPVMVGTIQAVAEGRQRVIRMVGGAAYALLSVALYGGCMLGIGLRPWDIAAGVVIAQEAGLAVRLWQEAGYVHVIAGSASDLRELAHIVDKFGSSRIAAIA